MKNFKASEYSDSEFMPKFKLIKLFPGIDEPIGTEFGNVQGWLSLGTKKGQHSTIWTIDYFTPWVGEFFEEI